METNTIKVKSFRVIDSGESMRLNRIQKLVCKLFKITPKRTYVPKIAVELDGNVFVYEMLIDELGRAWRCLGRSDKAEFVFDCGGVEWGLGLTPYRINEMARVYSAMPTTSLSPSPQS